MNNVNDEKLDTLWLIVKALYRAGGIGFVLVLGFLPFLFITDQFMPITTPSSQWND